MSRGVRNACDFLGQLESQIQASDKNGEKLLKNWILGIANGGVPGRGHEDVNGEKLTVKNGGFLVPIFARFTQSFSRFIRDINGEKKHLVIDDLFHG